MDKRLEELRQKLFTRLKTRNQNGISNLDMGQIMERVKAIDQDIDKLSDNPEDQAKRQLLEDERTELTETVEMVQLTIEQAKRNR